MEDIETDRSSHEVMPLEGAHEAWGLDTAAPGQIQANVVDQESQKNAVDNPHGIGALWVRLRKSARWKLLVRNTVVA